MNPVFKPQFKSGSKKIKKKSNDKGARDPEVTASPSNEEGGAPEPTKRQQQQNNLTDEDYDDIFSCVLEKASSGLLQECSSRATEKKKSSVDAFKEKMNVTSFTTVQDSNEITPTVSPLETRDNQKLLKAPEKKKDKSGEKKNKRSLDYEKKKTTLESVTKRLSQSLSQQSGKHKSHENGRKTEKKKKKKVADASVYDYEDEGKNVTTSATEKAKKRKHKKMKRVEEETVIDINQGVWVQCTKKKCLKWRFLSSVFDPANIDEEWTCEMNTDDPHLSNCAAPEVDWTECLHDDDIDQFIFTDYNAGSIVWAKMPSYPYWPAMVDNDPDNEVFYDHLPSGLVVRYHVVFLDRNVSRAWVRTDNIEPFHKDPNKLENAKNVLFADELKLAVKEANLALKLEIPQRIQKYNFESRYSNKEKGGKCWETHVKRGGGRYGNCRKTSTKSKETENKDSQVVPEVETTPVATPPSPTDDSPAFEPAEEHDDEETQFIPESPKKKKSKKAIIEEKVKEIKEEIIEGKVIETLQPVKQLVAEPAAEKTKKKKIKKADRPMPLSKKIKKPTFSTAFVAPSQSSQAPSVTSHKKKDDDGCAVVPNSSHGSDEVETKLPAASKPKSSRTTSNKGVEKKNSSKTKSSASPAVKNNKKTVPKRQLSLGLPNPSTGTKTKKIKPKFKAAFVTPAASQATVTSPKKNKKDDGSSSQAVVPSTSQEVKEEEKSEEEEELTLTKINSVEDDASKAFDYIFELKAPSIEDMELDENMIVQDGDLPDIKFN